METGIKNSCFGKPEDSEYPPWFSEEIELVPYTDLITGLSESFRLSFSLLQNLPEEKLLYRYQEGKWTIKEMWQHIIDVERVLTYRAMRYARKDKTVLQGFDQDSYALLSNANERPWNDILNEYADLRKASIHLFKSFDEDMLMSRGTAGRSELTVRAVGYLLVGHDVHHLNTVKEKYLGISS